MHLFSLITLQILFFSATAISNLNCVLREIGALRRHQPSYPTEPTSAVLVSTGTQTDPPSSSDKSNSLPTSPDGFLLSLIRGQGTAVSRDQKRLIEELCVPFAMTAGLERLVAVFVCFRVIRAAPGRAAFMAEYWDAAAQRFGELFALAARAGLSLQSDLKRDLARTLSHAIPPPGQKSLKRLAQKASAIYRAVAESFELEFATHIDHGLLSAQRTGLDLPKILADLLPGAKQPAELAKKATLLQLTLGLSLKDGSAERLAEFQEDLRTFAPGLRERAESPAFRQLLDRLSALRGHGLDPTQRLLQRTIYPRCYKAFSEKDLPRPTDSCARLLARVLDLGGRERQMFDRLTQNPQFSRWFESVLEKNLALFGEDPNSDTEALSAAARQELAAALSSLAPVAESLRRRAGDRLPDKNAALLWDLRHLLEPDNQPLTDHFAKTQILAKFQERLATQVYASAGVQRHIGELKNSLSRLLHLPLREVKARMFHDLLVTECNCRARTSLKAVCAKAARSFTLRSQVLPYNSAALARFLVRRAEEQMRIYDTSFNAELKLMEKWLAKLTRAAEELEPDLLFLDSLLPEAAEDAVALKISTVYIDGLIGAPSRDRKFAGWLREGLRTVLALKPDVAAGSSPGLRTWLFGFTLPAAAAVPRSEPRASLDEALLTASGVPPTGRGRLSVADLQTLMRGYHNFPPALKRALVKCELAGPKLRAEFAECKARNSRDCYRLNPFLLGPPCPPGFTPGLSGRCLASCPKGFGIFSDSLCSKPAAYLVDLRGGADQRQVCGPYFLRRGILCVPFCPPEWRDSGRLCERPVIAFDRSREVLLIK